jgi:hypothetical protein
MKKAKENKEKLIAKGEKEKRKEKRNKKEEQK